MKIWKMERKKKGYTQGTHPTGTRPTHQTFYEYLSGNNESILPGHTTTNSGSVGPLEVVDACHLGYQPLNVLSVAGAERELLDDEKSFVSSCFQSRTGYQITYCLRYDFWHLVARCRKSG